MCEHRYEILSPHPLDCDEIEKLIGKKHKVIVALAPPKTTLTDLLPQRITRSTMSRLLEGIHFTAGSRGRVWTGCAIYKRIYKHLTEREK